MDISTIPLTLITWIDSLWDDTPRPFRDQGKYFCYENHCVGFIVFEDDCIITLGYEIQDPQDLSSPTMIRGTCVIPKCCVLKRTPLAPS